MMQCRPMQQLWPICTRLSILVPSPMTVSLVAPRSMVELAPISTSSWMMTRRVWRIFLMSVRSRQIAEAVLADTDTRMDDDAIADQRMLDGRAGADRTVAADANTRPDHRTNRDHRAGADLGMSADDGERIERHVRFKARRRMHVCVLAASFHAEQR